MIYEINIISESIIRVQYFGKDPINVKLIAKDRTNSQAKVIWDIKFDIWGHFQDVVTNVYEIGDLGLFDSDFNLITQYRIPSDIIYKQLAKKYQPNEQVFCLGLNKTGTTSLAYLHNILGYTILSQYWGESIGLRHLETYTLSYYKEMLKTYNFFQDVPWSHWSKWDQIYHLFPEAKYVLTLRSSPSVWYESVIKYLEQVTGLDPLIMSWKDWDQLTTHFNQPFLNPIKGWVSQTFLECIGCDRNKTIPLQDKRGLIQKYLAHTGEIIETIPSDQLFIIDWKVTNIYDYYEWLGIEDIDSLPKQWPHENKGNYA